MNLNNLNRKKFYENDEYNVSQSEKGRMFKTCLFQGQQENYFVPNRTFQQSVLTFIEPANNNRFCHQSLIESIKEKNRTFDLRPFAF